MIRSRAALATAGSLLWTMAAGCITPPLADPGSLPSPPSHQAQPRELESEQPVIRGQQPEDEFGSYGGGTAPAGSSYLRQPMPVSGSAYGDPSSVPAAAATAPPPAAATPTPASPAPWTAQQQPFPEVLPPADPSATWPGGLGGVPPMNPEAELFGPPPIAAPPGVMPPPGLPADIIVDVEEDQTGRLMFGAGINSDLGLSFQAVLDERSFDIHQVPDSWDDIWQGRAFRGGGQRLRLEAIPGNRVQRYLISFTEPYLGNRPISLNASAYLYNRAYFDWDEERLGTRLALGYLLTPDLSLSVSGLAESLEVHRPRLRGVPELEAILGHSQLYAPGVTLAYDTRDVPFFPTEGQYLEMTFQQYFGSYTYPRGEVDYRRYLLLKERPDGSGRHVLGNMFRVGISGSDTPIVENFFAGGFATLRGFSFRGASPVSGEVRIGGPFMLLGSTEYIFPITADDMLRGVFFADYGTIEEDVRIEGDEFRLSLGFGVRITVPALGAAPLAVDFAVPVMHSDTDRLQNVSFWFGMGR